MNYESLRINKSHATLSRMQKDFRDSHDMTVQRNTRAHGLFAAPISPPKSALCQRGLLSTKV
jgi:hypothetical protein